MGKIITVRVTQKFIDNECEKITRMVNEEFIPDSIERAKYLSKTRGLVKIIKIESVKDE